MKKENDEVFSNRWGIVLASLGMAIGAGNLWRFPRLAGQYGGAFIILWILFLFVWSIPLLLAEFSIGKRFKKGVIGSYADLVGDKISFLGFFITFCTLGIAFYYAVVTAWAIRYFGFSIQSLAAPQSLGERLTANPNFLEEQWLDVSNGNIFTILIFIGVLVLGVYILSKGISNGLERANRILIPSLFILLIIVAAVSLNMKNGIQGLEYMFSIDSRLFSNPKIWIEALSQSAWSTGAGWGLLMTLSSYSRPKEDVTLNTMIGAFGNNTASLLAGMAILPAVFALAPSASEAESYLQSGNQALTFTIIPKLFANIPGGGLLSSLFFLALFLAALSSLLPMIELAISQMTYAGVIRRKAAVITFSLFILLGIPSAYSLNFFTNQDWVWGVGLILSGLFIALGVLKYGTKKFKSDMIDNDSDFKVSSQYFTICITAALILALVLIYWWLSQGYSENPWFDQNGNWNLFDVYSNASVVTQWGLVLIIGFIVNKYYLKIKL